MKKRTKWIIGGVLIISLIVVGSVYAFKKGNVDGVWGTIDPLQNLDIIGTIGDNPGTGWSNVDRSTYDATIRRNANICYGDTDGSDTFDLSGYTGFPSGTVIGLGSHSATCNGNNLIISEYVHVAGSDGQRAIEIYNPSDYPISLLGYKIQIYNDGSSTVSTTIDLTTNATLASHDVWVLSSTNISDVTEDQISTSLNFDGNDVVALVRGGDDGENYTGAECDNWATGPAGGTDPGGNPTTWQGSWFNQGPDTTDWNQVRYGIPENYTRCPRSTAGFLLQSGFGFDGVDSTGESYDVNEPFVLGVFCHYNRPILAPSEQGKLQSVPLNVTVSGLQCDDGKPPAGGVSSMTFTYFMRLDETTNTDVPLEKCPYPSTVSCSDAVFVSQPPASQQFTCRYGDPGYITEVKYTIAPLGFMTRNTDGSCPTWNAAQAKRDFISNEGTTNCGCLYGMITDMIVTEVQLLYFNAQPGEGVITLQWATATERDNYGFNLYRATSEDGERTLLNAELIPSLVAPGSPYGAEYEFVDSTAEAGVQYFYWLEDVDIYMKSTFHGPVTAILE